MIYLPISYDVYLTTYLLRPIYLLTYLITYLIIPSYHPKNLPKSTHLLPISYNLPTYLSHSYLLVTFCLLLSNYLPNSYGL